MKRVDYRFAVALLAMFVALPAGLDAGPAADARPGNGKGKGRSKTVTRTYASAGAIAAPVPGFEEGVATPYPATIAVSGLRRGRLLDVDVTLRILASGMTHELDLLLVAPNGANAIVMSDAGIDDSVPDLTLTLDDEAAAALPTGLTALTSGSFRPTNHPESNADAFPAPAPGPSGSVALSTFDGADPNGAWSLFVVDDATDDTHTIASWELRITAEITPSASKAHKGKRDGKGDGGGKGKGKGKGKYDGKGKGRGNGYGNADGNGNGGGKGKKGRGR